MKYVPWTDDFAEKELNKRFQFAKEARKSQEQEWVECERGMYAIDGGDANFNARRIGYGEDTGGSCTFIGTNRINHHVRYVHSQLATNPPMVLPKPTSNDPEDFRAADAANKLAHYALRQYMMQDTTDRVTLSTLIYGNGIGKPFHNPELGEVISYEEKTGEIQTEGDFEYQAVSPWNVYPDPDAPTWGGNTGIKWLFEEIPMDFSEAICLWSDKADILEQFRIREEKQDAPVADTQSQLRSAKYDVVRILQYWERGLPTNGLQGRFGWCVTNGTTLSLLEPLKVNPNAFPINKGFPGIAQIPHILLTDQDVPNSYWGKSSVAFAVKHQDARNMLDTAQLDILKAHGVARLVLFGGSSVNHSESITNSPLDIIVVEGNQKPDFVNPVPMPQGMISFTEALKRGEDEIFSINEAMMGQINRETAGTAMQYATQNGNAIRYRLFIKYTAYVEQLYKSFFNIVKKHWTTPRTIKVLGKEKAYNTMAIKGANIDGGFDVVAEYGTSFSLDPLQRRTEIMQMSPILKEAGISMKSQLRYMKMSALDNIYDRNDLGTDRQDEIFRKMIEKGEYIKPQEYQDHPAMLEYAQTYLMTAEFEYLPQDRKELIVKHYNERKAMAGTQMAQAQGVMPPAGGEEMGGLPGGAAPAPAGPEEPAPGNLMDLLTRG
jgi:hypothetical protein